MVKHSDGFRNEAAIIIIALQLVYLAGLSNGLKYVWGDAFDDPMVNGPDGNPYPWDAAAKIASKQIRAPRLFPGFGPDPSVDAPAILSPKETRNILLKAFQAQERGEYLPGKSFMPEKAGAGNRGQEQRVSGHRQGRTIRTGDGNGGANNSIGGVPDNNLGSLTTSHKNSAFGSNSKDNGPGSSGSKVNGDILASQGADGSGGGCVPSRLCPSTYNTTAPLYGVSLTSGQPVTIVQKFPDLLQQVVFQVCKTTECEVLQGECVQTYLPYLFLVIPLGPVTLTGQDYVLVESGCVCRPKYARKHDEPPPLPFIQAIQH